VRPLLVLALIAVASAGCGGRAVRQEPRLAHRDTAQLVALARQIERDATTDGCAARHEIEALQAKAQALVASGRVPLRLRAPLLGGVSALAADLPACAPPPPTPTKGHHSHGHGRHHEDNQDQDG